MVLTSELKTVCGINEVWLRQSLDEEANAINKRTDTRMRVYNSRPNHFTIVVDDVLEYMLDTTDYTAELADPTTGDTLLVAVADGSDNFEDQLSANIISAVYKTL